MISATVIIEKIFLLSEIKWPAMKREWIQCMYIRHRKHSRHHQYFRTTVTNVLASHGTKWLCVRLTWLLQLPHYTIRYKMATAAAKSQIKCKLKEHQNQAAVLGTLSHTEGRHMQWIYGGYEYPEQAISRCVYACVYGMVNIRSLKTPGIVWVCVYVHSCKCLSSCVASCVCVNIQACSIHIH